jgi:L-alanine-DL-glutamate epimerase-like enolase superfamily enzyme
MRSCLASIYFKRYDNKPQEENVLTRRSFLKSTLLTTGTIAVPGTLLRAQSGYESLLGKVKIRDIQTAALKLKYKNHLVKIITNEGIYGLGEAFPRAEVEQDIHTIKSEIIGEDPLQVEYLHQKLTEKFISRGSRTGALCGAISGIETALWDLAGKILNIPVYILLGGAYRKKLLIYHDTGSPKSTNPSEWLDEAEKSKAFGFKAMKFSLRRFSGENWNRSLSSDDIKIYINVLEKVRQAIGPDFPMAVDLHWKYNTRDAIRFVQAIEPLNLWFVEDPLPPENADAFARLTATSNVPIATGENLYTRQGFRPFIEKQACDMIQPDAQKCGGLLEMKKIADWADMYYINMLCHHGCTPVGAIASGHACMAIKSFLALESDNVDIPEWKDIIYFDGPIYNQGYLELPDKPGLGVELNEEICRKYLAPGSRFFE